MSTADITSKILSLPPQKREEVSDFVDFLLTKTNNKKSVKKPLFGSGKGMVTYMSDDFDEPLADFNEYMPS